MKRDELEVLRERISAVNRRLLDDLNRRLRLVGRIRDVKVARGLAFHDPARERRMLRELAARNEGPMTRRQLERVYREIFAVALEYLEAGGRKSGPGQRRKT